MSVRIKTFLISYSTYLFWKIFGSPILGIPTKWFIPLELIIVLFYWWVAGRFAAKEE